MNQPRDPDTIISTWLDTGPTALPDETRRAISAGVRARPRARRMVIAGGSFVRPFNRFAAAVAIVLASGLVSALVLSNRAGRPSSTTAPSEPGGSAATVTASGSPAPPSAPASASTAGWGTFTSSQYGFEIGYPPTWTARSATIDWVFARDHNLDFPMGPQTDSFTGGRDGNPAMMAFAADVPAGMSDDDFVAGLYSYLTSPQGEPSVGPSGDCTITNPTEQLVTVDGRPGRIMNSDCPPESKAFVFIGQRVYVFAIFDLNRRGLLPTFLSTVKLQP
jgi:hypothetical protein